MLANKRCVPCEGNVAPMNEDEINHYLSLISGWQYIPEKRAISKQCVFNNFAEAMHFVNTVAKIAEEEGHHPDIYIHDWKYVDITLSTHAINGLSENDFILAAKIDSAISSHA